MIREWQCNSKRGRGEQEKHFFGSLFSMGGNWKFLCFWFFGFYLVIDMHLQHTTIPLWYNQSSFLPSPVLQRTVAIHNNMPGYSFAISLPRLMPLPKVVLGKSLWLCRLNIVPYFCAYALKEFAIWDDPPIWLNKQSRVYLNIPKYKACSISIGQAPWIPRLLWEPKRILYKEFWIFCCDSNRKDSLSPASTNACIFSWEGYPNSAI